MIKALFKQLMNRKKSNGWIALELLLVFCVLWYLIDYFFVLTYNYSLPSYLDTDHTYQVNVTQFPSDHPEFKETENDPDQKLANYHRILNHIRSYPGVTHLSISFRGGTPGSDNYNGTVFRNMSDTTRTGQIRFITIDPASDYFGVFGYSEDNGKKKTSMQDYEWSQPNAVVLSRLAASQLFPGENAVGQMLEEPYSKKNTYRVAGVVDNTKRFASQRPEMICYRQMRLEAAAIEGAEISVRVEPSLDTPRFLPDFIQNMENSLRIGNFYFLSAGSYADNVAWLNEIFGYNTDSRVRLYLMIFFLINVVLCVIGTFWYRVNVRREEIGLRMALGSSRKGIGVGLIAEGLMLLGLVLLPALLIEWQFVHAGLIEVYGKGNSPEIYLPDKVFLRFIITNALTLLVMAVIIVLAIWIPARRATQLFPAEALRYE